MRNVLLGAAACLLALCVVSDVAVAHPITHNTVDDGWPPPGLGSLGGVGDAHLAGGRTWTFGAFDDSQYDDLFYSISTAFQPNMWSSLGGNPGAMSFAGYIAPNKAVWARPFLVPGLGTRQGYFVLTTTDLLNNPLALQAPGSHPGVNGLAGPILDVPDSGFKANWAFYIDTPTGDPNVFAAGPRFDAFPTFPNDSLNTSVGGMFWWNEPANQVPEPGTLALAVLGLGGLVVARRRRK